MTAGRLLATTDHSLAEITYVVGARRMSTIIRAHGYLCKRWPAGELEMPQDAGVDTYFGRAKKLKQAS